MIEHIIERINKQKSRLPILYVMCGLQCSGKSTKAKELKEIFDIYSKPDYKTVILSSDEMQI